MQASYCVNCKAELSGHTDVHFKDMDIKPNTGDFSVCIYCGSIHKFKAFGLSQASPEDLVGLFIEDQEVYNDLLKTQKFIKSAYWQSHLEHYKKQKK